jgi:uncharacterized protein (TIGR03083 family)
MSALPERQWSDPLEEMRYALAEGDAATPPAGLQATVQTAALQTRPAGRPSPGAPDITPLEAYRRSAITVDQLVDALTDDEWRRHALRDMDVQGLIGHLIGVEHHFRAGAGLGDPIEEAEHHIASTQPFVDAQTGRPPAATRAEFRALIDRTLTDLDRAGEDVMAGPATMHGITLPLGSFLVVRAFEMWTHADDIRRAIGRPVAEPDASSLQLMTSLAVALLPAGMAGAERDAGGRSVRLVLTGKGGGTWPTVLAADGPAGDGDALEPSVRIVADAVAFCRLIANREDQDTFPAQVSGDEDLARDLFAGAAALAFD